jgi:RimJ/RimL family protein N-acetyltransferase
LGQGYCTEAAREMVCYGFEVLGLHRIHVNHFGSNPSSPRVMQSRMETCCIAENAASARVMEKAGTRGHLERVGVHQGAYRDMKLYSILRREYRRV